MHACILGIDGSGKSTIVARLPGRVASELRISAATAGDRFSLVEPSGSAGQWHRVPIRLSISAIMSKLLKRAAKRYVNSRLLYPLFKVMQMLAQDAAAQKLARRHRSAVMISDGNAVLSTIGRAANYLRPASAEGYTGEDATCHATLRGALRYLVDGRCFAARGSRAYPALILIDLLRKSFKYLGLELLWLPDAVIFLDLSPESALKRIKRRGNRIDRHENLDDMDQARTMYVEAVNAFAASRAGESVLRLGVDRLSVEQTLGEILRFLGRRSAE